MSPSHNAITTPAGSNRLRNAILIALGSACVGLSPFGNANGLPDWNCQSGPGGNWACSDHAAADTPVEPKTPPPETTATTPVTSPQTRPPAVAKKPVPNPAPTGTTVGSGGPATTRHGAPPDLDAGIDWPACDAGSATPAAAPAAMPSGKVQPIHISANSSEASTTSQTALFTGDVVVRQGDQKIHAQRVEMNRRTGEVNATGQVQLDRPDLRLAASQVEYNLHTRKGEAQQAEYRLPTVPARGTAKVARLDNANQSEFDQISYSTCPPGHHGWELNAQRLLIDRADGLGTAHDAKLSFLGVPIMYLPEMTFPIDKRRRSGLLLPKVGYDSKLGLDLAVPYYFNLAPNYDLTLTPRLMTKRGLMLGGDYRFLTATTAGSVSGTFLPSDRGDNNRNRSSVSVVTDSRFTPHISASVNFNQVSDGQYLSDFGGDLNSASTSFLDREGKLSYDSEYWSLRGLVQSYQVLDTTISKADQPYARLPQISFALDRPATGLPLDYLFNAEYVNFAKSGGFVEGQRLTLEPGISMPIRGASYFVTPSLAVHYTSYRLTNQTPGLDSSPSIAVPVLSLDSGLYFDRNTRLFGQRLTETLEPRIRYLLVPRRNQDAIPLFDTGLADLSYAALFRDNRFIGGDRIGDANQASIGVTSRYLDAASGRELLRASLGQTIYFSDRTVQLTPTTPVQTNGTSPLMGELSADLGDGWRGRGGLAWDPYGRRVDQGLAQVGYRGKDGRLFNLTLFKHQGVQTFTDVAALWPVSGKLKLIGRWDYSLTQHHNLETLAGLEYGNCCWKVRGVIRRYADYTAGAGSSQNTAFLLELELNGLGAIGDNIESLLDGSIYGYRGNHD